VVDPRDSSSEETSDDEDAALDVVTALCAAGMADDSIPTDDVALTAEACVGAEDALGGLTATSEELLAPTTTPAAVTVDEPAKADEAWEATEATVCKVVAALGGATPAAAMIFIKDSAPHRQEQSHEPSDATVPVPWAIAPGEPTAGAAARRMLVEAFPFILENAYLKQQLEQH
jgi:hypothetical protein